jgi:predicted nucleotidyltransferase
MQPLIEARRAEIGEICRRFHVRRLDVFGSAARDDFDPARSDVDLLALFEPMAPAAYAQAYFGMVEALGALFDRTIDLITEPTLANPYLRAQVDAERRTIFAAAA